jgi:hypothetical protein
MIKIEPLEQWKNNGKKFISISKSSSRLRMYVLYSVAAYKA